MGLAVRPYTLADLDTLTTVLQARLNEYGDMANEAQRDSFDTKGRLFNASCEAYDTLAKEFPFLKYKPHSIKPSLFSYVGNYLGFQGYYNPFSGEGQVNTTVPNFLVPYVTTHEMAHQLGYAKENEANFVGFLACHFYNSPVFRYSVYFDMYRYAIGEIYGRDTLMAKAFHEKLHPQVKKDIRELRDFFIKYKNPVEPIIMWFYGHYLKANNQPAGKESYNEVVAWLIAYYKKFGRSDKTFKLILHPILPTPTDSTKIHSSTSYFQ